MIAKDVMRKDYVKVDQSYTVSELVGELKAAKQTVAFIFDKNEFLGIITLKDLIKTRMGKNEKIERKIWHVPSISEEENLVDIATLMFHSNSSALPVVESNRIIGAAFANDIIKQIRNIPELKNLRVSEIRHPVIKKIKENDRIGKAFEMMVEQDINRIPVVDDNNKLVGIVTFGDIMDRFLAQPMKRMGGFKSIGAYPSTRSFKGEREDILALPVRDFEGTKNMITAKPEDGLTKIADLMADNNISGIIITKNNEADSIVTKRDLLEAIMNTKKVTVRNIQFIGLNELKDVHPHLKSYVKKISSFYAEKIQYMLQTINSIKVHIKQHSKGGRAHKYSVHVQVIAPTVTINSTKAVDWDISRVMHKAFKDIESQLVHKFKADSTYKKRYF